MNKLSLDLILEPEQLEAVLGDPRVVVIDVCQARTYQQLHVPGAIHVDPAELIGGVPPAIGKLPPIPRLKELFSRIGYHPDKHIVVYDDEGGGWAGRFIWTLDVIGHRHYSYLNGGLHAWQLEGHPVSNEAVEPEACPVHFSINHSVIASLEEVKASLSDDNVRIWDARSAGEYSGEKVTAKRNGHIPGAVNLDWLQTMDRERNLRLRPIAKLQQELTRLGIQQGNEIITHCQTHHRSGLTYLIAKALGYKVKAYDGSWSEWGNLPDTPIDTGSGGSDADGGQL